MVRLTQLPWVAAKGGEGSLGYKRFVCFFFLPEKIKAHNSGWTPQPGHQTREQQPS